MKFLHSIVVPGIIALTYCERCYVYTGDIPVFVNVVKSGTVESRQEFCESGLNAQAELGAYESEGYVCDENRPFKLPSTALFIVPFNNSNQFLTLIDLK